MKVPATKACTRELILILDDQIRLCRGGANAAYFKRSGWRPQECFAAGRFIAFRSIITLMRDIDNEVWETSVGVQFCNTHWYIWRQVSRQVSPLRCVDRTEAESW